MKKLFISLVPYLVFIISYFVSKFEGFSHPQAVIVAFILSIIFYLYHQQQTDDAYKPFRLSILPHWGTISKDYKNPVGKELNNKKLKMTKMGESLTFTFLKNNLIFFDTMGIFIGGINQSFPIFANEPLGGRLTKLFVHYGRNGYEIGLKYWGDKKSFNEERIVLAVLPYSEISHYFSNQNWSEKQIKKEIRELENNGWKNEHTEYPENSYLTHKYFSVSHGEI